MDRSACVHGLIEAQVARTPDAIAIVDGAERITYRELLDRALRVASRLRIAPETPVGVSIEPSIDQIVAVLGVLEAGGAYVPLDPEHPAERIARIVEDAAIQTILTRDEVAAAACAPAQPTGVDVGPDHAIYILYTSGSTGVPKGVVGVHRAITNRLHWQQDVYPYVAGEVACARTPLGFVDSVAEIFAPLAFGVPLVIVPRDAQRDPTLMIARLAAERATRIVIVPSLLATLLDVMPDLGERVPSLRYWFVGGEPVPVALVEEFRRRLPGRKLVNIYGATEVSGDATYFDFDRMPPGLASSPIGIALTGCRVELVDGEVCASGVCLARGYLNKPELTAERFFERDGVRWYRLGDLGCVLPSGDLQYLGRIDSQVKIRGMRVELGEVEARLVEHPRVSQAVAIARSDGGLAAFYTGGADPAEVRAHAAAALPDYAVPSYFVPLDELPRNASRKIDRRALRDWPVHVGAGEPLANDGERRIARIWEDVLGHAAIARDHAFHELGGTSLAAVRIVARLREALGVEVPLASLFAHPTVAALAAHVGELAGTAARAPIPVSDAMPAELALSTYQRPFWLFRALSGDTSVVIEVFGFTQAIDVERLQAAFSEAVGACDALWMQFPRWRAVQRLVPRVHVRFDVGDAADLTLAVAEVASLRFEQPPHVHARLVTLPGGEQRLVVVMPHITVDMTAMELFRQRLDDACAGRAPLPQPRATLADFVAWDRGNDGGLAADRDFWADIPLWTAVPDRLRRAYLDGEHPRAVCRRPLPARRFAEIARGHGTTLPIAVIGAVSAGLSHVLERDDLTLVLMIEKRDRPELDRLFTTLTSLMPVRVRAPVRLAALHADLMLAYEHTDHLMRWPILWRPLFGQMIGARGKVVVALNILPEVYQPEPDGSVVVRRRRIEHMLRPGDMMVGTDAWLDRTLQIHVTREDGELVVNLYGGGFDQAALDEVASAIAAAAEVLA